jgi:hypothetical protein
MAKLNFEVDAGSDVDELLDNIKGGLILKHCRSLVLIEADAEHVADCLRMYVKLRCKLWSQTSEGVLESLGWFAAPCPHNFDFPVPRASINSRGDFLNDCRYEWISSHAVAACVRAENLDWLLVLIHMWRDADLPRTAAVVHHMCSMILANPKASSQLQSVYSLAHKVLWPTIADVLRETDGLDPDDLSVYPQHLFSNEFSCDAWASMPPCTDSDNILANLDASCGIIGSVSLNCLYQFQILSFDCAQFVIGQMSDIKAGCCISHFLLWSRLSAALSTGDVKLLLLEATASQDRAAVLVAPSLKHANACFRLATERVGLAMTNGDIEPSVSLLIDFIEVDSRLQVGIFFSFLL